MGSEGATTLIIDGNNVVGAGAAGWWRDPPAAVRRLLDRVRCYRTATGVTLVLVLDVPQPDLAEGDNDGVVVRYATRRGRDAADERILELLDAGVPSDASRAGAVEVITSDRALADGARQRGALVTGAGTFLARLTDRGC
jgi:predicted RNA-binding protein with PIN domain